MTKIEKINAILEAMQEAYEEEGIDGDFADGRNYYLNHASMEEIDADHIKWCK